MRSDVSGHLGIACLEEELTSHVDYGGKDLTKLSEPLVSWKEFVGSFNWEGIFP